MRKIDLKSLVIGLSVGLIILASAVSGALADRLFDIKPLDLLYARIESSSKANNFNQKLVNEESVVIAVAEEVSPSVVTVAAQSPRRRILQFSPFGGIQSRIEGGEPEDIGSGFIVSKDGLIITNKHVVNDAESSYKVITKDGTEHDVVEINTDPSNDIAVLKIDANNLIPVKLGDSANLKAGQFVIAIGTALGEFRHTVTTGVISGLGRGITAGSVYEGFVERLDDVIQTDAAINPGNSGGPLLNSGGEVIGVNVAVAQGAQNIGFAIPIDIVKNALSEFNKTGSFPKRPFLGVQYQMIDKEGAILNNIPEGAYVTDIVDGSPAQKTGIQSGDIITKIDSSPVSDDDGGLTGIIADKEPGTTVSVELWRDEKFQTISVTLSEYSQ